MIWSIWENFKAWRRGEARIAPRGVRGRVYARITEPINVIAAQANLKPSVSFRVYRAAEGAWYRAATRRHVVIHGEVVPVDPEPGELEKEG